MSLKVARCNLPMLGSDHTIHQAARAGASASKSSSKHKWASGLARSWERQLPWQRILPWVKVLSVEPGSIPDEAEAAVEGRVPVALSAAAAAAAAAA
eukprot:CAMPEP_0194757764 /NCGR_PEP_ID=MMETSP0323_2-20130528/11190_1 /TAXON_ID=2866 ORGANISM="Crypthecodinium cohnii, Strain Seligo" /NCGR_SAMPLE_ID=MMETSP0323_2 /ASSEMBLY_ACC=CAM_ASM_000346 /LENGTH=96 /DNA_ID=CAMNT_0039677833 /DNA_START=143 /DNA_END=431 /DNA_ORIENTATION=+